MGRWPPNIIGAGWMFLGALAFTLMTTLVKYQELLPKRKG